MRASLAVSLLLLPFVLGCLGSDEGLDEQAEPAALELPGIARYTANGTMLPVTADDVVGTASYVLTGHVGAEPNVGITRSGAILTTAFDETIRSRDGGITWETVYDFALLGGGAPLDPYSTADPMLWVDPVTDRVYTNHMYPGARCSTIIWSDDEGDTWSVERHGACGTPMIDHQKLATGVPGPDGNPLAGVAYETVAYICYNKFYAVTRATACTTSYDGGLTWTPDQPVVDRVRHGCGGLNGHPNVAPDGTVVVAVSWLCDTVNLGVSSDSGLSWDVVQGPDGLEPAEGWENNDPDIAFTPDGTMYLVYIGADRALHLLRTQDLGASWDGPFRVTPPGVNSTVFSVISAGDDGRIATAFLGTRDTDAEPSEAPDDARWHLYIVTSDDADAPEPTFTAHQVTPDEDPVQIGCVWMYGGGNECRNMLDFIDSATGPNGTFHVVYTEGCTDDCAGDPEATPDDSRDRQVALAKLDGWSLGPS